ncbi:bis(5'-nucleosyl)-tetraphosphatase, putative [Cordyceps militaris CM01]|uniref:Bis(5'-nucleosyl)-tetraphosphatase, putative n=1 Tax=Cordyceps militaris (strain CM01) TaxID=983644 RepID=G3JBH6_CORMM|nr:bis(5'-nucleosyl)-tetraphosphatase, putative [Cordyceps militaris CM01]EGX94483.1 bis(5'-nucleosyl)-tetraphosphatase, putative [Cordyceps militaris CM01]
MASLKAPARLLELVKAAFAKALADGDLFYFATQVQDMRVGALSFQLRFSPALANKPKPQPPSPKRDAAAPSKPFDPFEYTSPPGPLFVGDVGASHFLVLNKFAVVPGHFILATRAYRAQTHVLEADDLHATLACLRACEEEEEGVSDGNDGDGALFAFFNGGAHSGASQPHRHIQMLPVRAMREGLPAASAWRVLMARRDAVAPFTTFAEDITLSTTREDLYAAYLRLYQQAVRAVRGEDEFAPASGEAAISYNMAMTRDRLVLCPRLAEGGTVTDPDTGAAVGTVSLNGTMLAGTALVKTEAEWEALRRHPRALTTILGSVGVSEPRFIDDVNKL